jgi:hypothetical protein
MKNENAEQQSVSEFEESTGLPWPKTWKGVYLFVVGSFVLWLLLLYALTEFYK